MMKKSATQTVQDSGMFHGTRRSARRVAASWPRRLLTVAVLLLAAVAFGGVFAVTQAQATDGTITGLTLTSDSPGILTVSWDTPSPAPTDYRVRWAPVESDYLSWKDDNGTDRGNAYPAGDYDSNGLHVGAKTSTGFGAGRIKAAGTDGGAVHVFAGVNSSQRVDGRVRVDGMEVISHPASGRTYRAGETFEFAMVFSRPVEVEGTIHLSMRVGSDDPAIGWRAATYRRAHGSDSLIFGYTVRFGDVDTDGITVLGSWVGYDGTVEGIGGSGSIKVAGTDFEIEPPEFTGVTNLGGHKVNGNPDTESVGGL